MYLGCKDHSYKQFNPMRQFYVNNFFSDKTKIHTLKLSSKIFSFKKRPFEKSSLTLIFLTSICIYYCGCNLQLVKITHINNLIRDDSFMQTKLFQTKQIVYTNIAKTKKTFSLKTRQFKLFLSLTSS